jgi:hypothetical protein
MKVKCIKLLDSDGKEEKYSAWLTLEKTYLVLSITIDSSGKRFYAIMHREDEESWPCLISHRAECFEIISTIIPSNWHVWVEPSSMMGASPLSWQDLDYIMGFADRNPEMYPIFLKEYELMLKEDP